MLFHCDGFDFDGCAFGECSYGESGACWEWRLEEIGIDLVDGCEVIDVGEQDCYFHNVAHGESFCLQYALDVGERLTGFATDASFLEFSCGRVDRKLPADVNCIACLDSLAVWAYGSWGVGSGNRCHGAGVGDFWGYWD